jgi:hypothetical protein
MEMGNSKIVLDNCYSTLWALFCFFGGKFQASTDIVYRSGPVVIIVYGVTGEQFSVPMEQGPR